MPVTDERFEDRAQAGRQLAERLQAYVGRDDVLALGLTRGGAAAAAALAQALDVPFDVVLVRRLQVPGHEELPLGAAASTGVVVLDKRAARELNLSLDALDAIVGAAVRDLDREARSYRGERPPPDVAGQVAILVDDAVITGDRMRAAVRAVRGAEPARVVIAVPVASTRAAAELRALADEAVCLREPERLRSPDDWYVEPGPPEEPAVQALLARAKPAPASGLAEALRPLADDAYAVLLERAAQADFVLIGEASHGTHEFYAQRAQITRRLIEEEGLPRGCRRGRTRRMPTGLNRYVKGGAGDGHPEEAINPTSACLRAFPSGCGATLSCWSSSAGSASTTTSVVVKALRASASMAWTCTVSSRLHRGGHQLPRSGRSRGRGPRPRALFLLRPLRPRAPALRIRDRARRRRAVRAGRGGRAAGAA